MQHGGPHGWFSNRWVAATSGNLADTRLASEDPPQTPESLILHKKSQWQTALGQAFQSIEERNNKNALKIKAKSRKQLQPQSRDKHLALSNSENSSQGHPSGWVQVWGLLSSHLMPWCSPLFGTERKDYGGASVASQVPILVKSEQEKAGCASEWLGEVPWENHTLSFGNVPVGIRKVGKSAPAPYSNRVWHPSVSSSP